MNKDRVENLVLSAFTNATPDLFDKIKADCEKKKGIEVEIKKQSVKTLITKRFLAYAATFVIVFGVLIATVILMLNNTPFSYVYIDVNPSFTISLNRYDKVISVYGNNRESKELIKERPKTNRELEDTVKDVISLVKENDYLTKDDNSILLSVSSEENEKENDLLLSIFDAVTSKNDDNTEYNIITQCCDKDDSTERKAKNNDTSVGKVCFVKEIASNTPYTFDNLISLRINDLANIIVDNNIKLKDSININGKISSDTIINKEKAVEIAFDNLNIEKGSADSYIELGSSSKTLVYIVTINYNKTNCVFKIDAHSGEIVEYVSFDGTVYENKKYLEKTQNTASNNRTNYDSNINSNPVNNSGDNDSLVQDESRAGRVPNQSPNDPKSSLEKNNDDENQTSDEKLPEIFTNSTCIYKKFPIMDVMISYTGTSIPFSTSFGETAEYYSKESYPYSMEESTGIVALICNKEQFYDFFSTYDNNYSDDFFEDNALVGFLYELRMDKNLVVKDILKNNNSLYFSTEIKDSGLSLPTPSLKYLMCTINKSDIIDITDIKTGF